MNDLIFIAMLCTSGLINLSSFDDALIDLLAFGIARASLATRRAVIGRSSHSGGVCRQLA